MKWCNDKKMKVAPTLAFFLLGFAATIGQILVLRELLIVFCGSELAVAIVLAAWLFWTAMGGLLGGRISRLHRRRQVLFAYLQGLSGFLLIGTILLIRASRLIFHIGAGELVTLGQMLAISFFTLTAFCIISGSLFSLACAVLADQIPGWSRSPGLVYALEGSGAGMGGLLFTLVLIHHLSAVKIASLVAFLLCVSGLLYFLQTHESLRLRVTVFSVMILGLVAVQFQSSKLDTVSRQWHWSEFRVLDSEETVFGQITVVARDSQLSFFENGLWNFSVPDLLSAEEAVHYALLQHPQPSTVLLIGGGVSGSLAQMLLHPSIRKVDYVELDPKLIQLGKIHLPADVTSTLTDPRVVVHHEDGRRYLSNTTNLYDLILLNLPEPVTAQINRFYTKEFFHLAVSKMAQGGVFFFSASGAETALGPTQAKYLKLLYRTALSVFPEVVVLPGQIARFFCSNSRDTLTTLPETMVQRLQDRHLQLRYVQDHYMLWDLAPMRQGYFMTTINQANESGVNTDLNPRAYSYKLLLWGTQYSRIAGKVFATLDKRTVWTGVVFFSFLATALALVFRFKSAAKPFPQTSILYAVAIFGFTEISLEVLIIFAFQVFFGYVYHKIGLLLALFMVGLAAGSITLSYFPRGKASQLRALITFQFVLACFCLGLAATIVYFQNRPELSPERFFYREAFSLMSLTAGFIGGTHFPLVNRLLLEKREQVGTAAGTIYAIDLLGSFLGCLLVGLVLIPLVGILQTLFVLALVNLTAIVPLIGIRPSGTHS